MAGDRHFARRGYLGIALLASMITVGVMLLLFTEGQASPMRIDVGDVLAQPCDDGSADGPDVCYAVVVTNVSDGEVSGSVACSVPNPTDGFATFVNGKHTYDSEPIPPGDTATLIIQVDLINGVGETETPSIDCVPA